MAEAGAAALADPMVSSDRDRAEGLRYLSRQLVFATQHAVEFRDPNSPQMQRFDDDITKWGGPNADNHYLRCAIDPSGLYLLTTDVSGCHSVIFSLSEGDMPFGRHRMFGECSLRDLRIDDGHLKMMIGPPESKTASEDASSGSAAGEGRDADNWMLTNPDVCQLLIRVYLYDWACDAVPDFYIERVDLPDSPLVPLDIERMARSLEEAASWVETSVPYWLRLMERVRHRSPDNRLAPPQPARGGAESIAYGGGFWRLGDDDVWLIEFVPPEASGWSIQTNTWPWFESGDLAQAQTSLNQAQAHVDTDGRVRVVICHLDPGVPNWIDTEGRAEGLCIYRWIEAKTMPYPNSTLIEFDDLRQHLPEDHPVVTPEQRREILAVRRRSVHRRFRR